MGTILASDIIGKVQVILQDTTGIRWPATELLGWVSDGQREICALRPSVGAITGNISLVAGTRQSLPAGASSLVSVMRNMGAGGVTPSNGIRLVPQGILDSQVPLWHGSTPTSPVKHYIYDQRAPRQFYVYPPAVTPWYVEAIYLQSPVDIASVATAITIDDLYAGPLKDYTLFRAYSKDMELIGNSARSAEHRGLFETFMKADMALAALLHPAVQVQG